MMQILFLLILLFSNLFYAIDPYFKIESVDQCFKGQEIAWAYLDIDQDQKSVRPEENHSCDLSRRVKTDFPFNSSLFVSASLQPSNFQKNYSNEDCNKLLTLAILQAQMGPKKFQEFMNQKHFEKYGESNDFLWGNKISSGLYGNRNFQEVADWIIGNKNLTHKQADNVWNDYCSKRFIGQNQKDKNGLRIQQEYEQRDQKVFEKKKQIQEKQRKEVLEFQQQEDMQKLQNIYNNNFLISCVYQSPYQEIRQQALEKTKQQRYKKYEQKRKFDEQFVGLCMAKDVDYKKLQHSVGTAMQHQLYDEVADCYIAIAKLFCQPSFSESLLAQHSLDIAQQVSQATELEAMELAIALSDLAHLLVDTAQSIFVGARESVHGIAEIIIDPIGTAKNLGHCLGKVMSYVAQAMQYADPETPGWSYYIQILEQEHGYDAVYAEAVINQMKDWIKNSSGQEKIKVASRLLTDSILYPKFITVLSNSGKIGCSLIVQIPEIKFLEGFADVFAEQKLSTNLGDVGLNGMQDVGMSLMKSEFEAVKYGNVIKIRSFGEALPELQKYGARCKLFQKELTVLFEDIFYKEQLLQFYKSFKNPLCIEVMNQGEKVKFFCDLEHIMTYNLKFKPNKSTGLIEGFISGGHVGTYTKTLEKAGEIVILAEQALPGGVRVVKYQHKFGSFIAQKTEYPLHWTAQDIVDSIKRAWCNQVFNKNEVFGLKVIGTGKDNILIEMYAKRLPDGSFRIKSAYPYYKEFSGTKL